MARSNEITIAISSIEEDIRKLYEASKMGSIQILNTLLQDDPKLIQKISIISTTFNVESPLHESVFHGHLEFTRVLLDHSPELVVEVDAFQRTPLHLAVTNGYLEIVRALLEKNMSACLVRDHEGLIPLHYAVINGQIEVIQELINAIPQSVWIKLENGQTILHLCVEGNHLEGMKFLTEIVANQDIDFLNTMDEVGNTILDLSFKLKQIEMVKYLLSIPEEVKIGTNIRNFGGRKGSLESKNKMSKKFIRKRREFTSSSTKKTRGQWKVLQNKLKYKGDWVQEVQGIMMLVATVIATVTFQAGINPPGGVWQQDTPYNSSNNTIKDYNGSMKIEKVYRAGTAIMAYPDRFSTYSTYLIAITVSFMASASVILLVVSRFPLKNRICSMLLSTSMFLAVYFLTVGFTYGVFMVNPRNLSQDKVTIVVYCIASCSWLGLVLMIGTWHLIRFLLWVVNWPVISSKLISHCFQSPHIFKKTKLNHFAQFPIFFVVLLFCIIYLLFICSKNL